MLVIKVHELTTVYCNYKEHNYVKPYSLNGTLSESVVNWKRVRLIA
jgi:hypothetical protein